MFKRRIIVLALAIITLLSLANSHVIAGELYKIQSKIKSQKAGWVAGETSISKLPIKDRQKRLGLYFPEKEPDDMMVTANISSLIKSQVVIPSSLDWRNNGGNFVTPVRNQGNCGSCWAFATTGALESATLIANNTPGLDLNLAEQILVSCSGAGDCGGGYIDSASDFIQTTGLPSESCYPYIAQNGYCGSACLNWELNTYKINNWQWIATLYPTVETLKAALNAYGPLVTTMNVYYDFYYYRSGIYRYVSGGYQGGHGILLVGYDDPGQYFIAKNSWGTGWGESGFFKIAYSEISSVVNFGRWTIAYVALPNTTESSITVVSPNGGETLSAGNSKTITWNYTGDPGYLKIELLKGSSVVSTIASMANKGVSGSGSYNWTIPTSITTGSDYRIKITSNSNSSVSDISDDYFTINGPFVKVTSPNGGETWTAGSYKTITWTYTGDPGYLKIELLKGTSVVSTISSYAYKGSSGSGSYNWTVPSNTPSGSDYKIKITGTSNPSMTDMSDNCFTIIGPSVTVTSPNGGETWTAGSYKTITWTYTGDPGYLKIELLKGTSVVSTISSYAYKGSSGSGSYNWTVPSNTPSGSDYKIKITGTSNPSMTDMSDNCFTIIGPSVTVTSPNGGETWKIWSYKYITWKYTGNPGYLKIELVKGNTVVKILRTYVYVGSNGTGSSYISMPSVTPGSDYKIKITSTSNSSITDTSDNYFTITN